MDGVERQEGVVSPLGLNVTPEFPRRAQIGIALTLYSEL